MEQSEALDLVAAMAGVPMARLRSERIDDFPEYYYVTVTSPIDEPLVGGSAFIVDTISERVHRVSASRPPAMNCRTIRSSSGLASRDDAE